MLTAPLGFVAILEYGETPTLTHYLMVNEKTHELQSTLAMPTLLGLVRGAVGA